MKKRVQWALLSILAVLLIGAAGFRAVYHAPWLLSLYYALATMATVSDARLVPTTDGQIVFTMLMIGFGTGLWILGLSILVSYFLESDLGHFKERRLMVEIQRLRGHFIVVGAGRVGESIARELIDMGEQVVVVDKDLERVERLREGGFRTVVLHGFDAEAFGPANVRHAKGIALALPDDAQNLYAYLTVRDLNENLIVVARAQTPESAHYLHNLGIERVILPDVVGGRRLARMLVKPVAHDLLMALLNEEGVQVNEVMVDHNSPMLGHPVQRVREIFGAGATLIGYWRNQTLHMAPKADDVIQLGDTLILVQASDGKV